MSQLELSSARDGSDPKMLSEYGGWQSGYSLHHPSKLWVDDKESTSRLSIAWPQYPSSMIGLSLITISNMLFLFSILVYT